MITAIKKAYSRKKRRDIIKNLEGAIQTLEKSKNRFCTPIDQMIACYRLIQSEANQPEPDQDYINKQFERISALQRRMKKL